MTNKLAGLFLIYYYINFLLLRYNIYIFDPLEFFLYTPDFNFYIQTLVHDKTNTCPFCEKIVKTRDKVTCCGLCIKWIHIRCNNLNDLDYEYLRNSDETWYCKTCIQEILPFSNKKINPNTIILGNAGIDPNLKNLLCQLNNRSEKENIDNENLTNCKYRDIYYFSNLDVKPKSKCLSFFHPNINSFSKNFDNFNHLINELKLEFDILGISESRILKSQSLSSNVSL